MTFKELFSNVPTFVLIGGLVASVAVTQFQVQTQTKDLDLIHKKLEITQIEHAEYKVKINNLDSSQKEFKDTLNEVNKTLSTINATLHGLQATIEGIKGK